MGWTAGSLWMIAISRDGFENILTVAVRRAWRSPRCCAGGTGRRVDSGVAGVAIALGLWTYQPLKLLPLLAILWLLWMRARDRDRFKAVRATWPWALAAFARRRGTDDRDGDHRRVRLFRSRRVGLRVLRRLRCHRTATRCTCSAPLGMFLFTGDPNLATTSTSCRCSGRC